MVSSGSDAATLCVSVAQAPAKRKSRKRDTPLSLLVRCQPDDIAAGLFVALELQAGAFFSRLQQRVEGPEPVIGLGESGIPALERLLDHRAPDFFILAALRNQCLYRLDDQIQRLLPTFLVALFRRDVAFLPRC